MCCAAPSSVPLQALPLEEDVRVPLFIRGPGVQAGMLDATQTNLIDIAPTLLTLAGGSAQQGRDGTGWDETGERIGGGGCFSCCRTAQMVAKTLMLLAGNHLTHQTA